MMYNLRTSAVGVIEIDEICTKETMRKGVWVWCDVGLAGGRYLKGAGSFRFKNDLSTPRLFSNTGLDLVKI